MKKSLLLLFLLVAGWSLHAQFVVKPSLGLTALPAPSTPICPWTTYLDPDGTFNSSGLQIGDTAVNFTLYEANGTPHTLSDDLQAGKPVLLIAGSYTCPVFRNKVPVINQVVAQYGSALQVYIIYQNEAHPWGENSPYFDYENSFPQFPYDLADTYGERLSILNLMTSNHQINATILVDGPCDEWQKVYGPSPNNATLIAPSGIVFAKHGWFHRAPAFNIFNDIEALLEILPEDTTQNNTNGIFNYTQLDDSLIVGNPGETLTIHGNLVNTSSEDVTILITRTGSQLPANWASSLCTDICLPPHINSTDVYVPAESSQTFAFYFYTDSVPGNGQATVSFLNMSDTSNTLIVNYYASTLSSGVREVRSMSSLGVYPNPVTGGHPVYVKNPGGFSGSVFVRDINGRLVHEGQWTNAGADYQINSPALQAGMYAVSAVGEKYIYTGKVIVE